TAPARALIKFSKTTAQRRRDVRLFFYFLYKYFAVFGIQLLCSSIATNYIARWRVTCRKASTASKISIVALRVRGEVSYLTHPQRPFLILSSHAYLFFLHRQVPR
ncbi:unnamed protein product, partial [Ectocarpus sp. 8 AP-2014]